MSDFRNSYLGIVSLGVISSLIATVVWENRSILFNDNQTVRPTNTVAKVPSNSVATKSPHTGTESTPLAKPPFEEDRPAFSRVEGPTVDPALLQAIESWRQALLSNDPARIAGCYAHNIERIYHQKRVTNEYVQSLYKDAREAGKLFETVELSDIESDNDLAPMARVQFKQAFTYGDKTANVRTVLHLINQDGACSNQLRTRIQRYLSQGRCSQRLSKQVSMGLCSCGYALIR